MFVTLAWFALGVGLIGYSVAELVVMAVVAARVFRALSEGEEANRG